MSKRITRKGFTLMELLIVIGIIAILAAIVIIAINPARQLAQARNAQRWSNVNTDLNAIHQESLDNSGNINAAITAACPAIQTIDSGAGGTGVDLSSFVPDYLAALPTDPSAASGVDTGYTVCREGNRVTVAAPAAELGATISATR